MRIYLVQYFNTLAAVINCHCTTYVISSYTIYRMRTARFQVRFLCSSFYFCHALRICFTRHDIYRSSIRISKQIMIKWSVECCGPMYARGKCE